MASDCENSDVKPVISDLDDRVFVLNMIQLYRENSVLWDTNDEHYTNKYRRLAVLKKICNILKSYKPNYTIDELRKKLNSLRTNFNKVRNRIEVMKLKSPDQVLKPYLWYYNEMTFLIGHQSPFISNKNRNPGPILVRNLKRKKINIISKVPRKNTDDEEYLVAKCWALKLRKLEPIQRRYAEKIINYTLLEAEMGNLTRHGVKFHADTDHLVCIKSE